MPPFDRSRRLRAATLAAYVAVVLVFLASIAQFRDRATGFTTLVHFGDQFYGGMLPAVRAVPRYSHPGLGYDGQFYAQLAVEPLLRDRALDQALDTPPYRARRILFAWTAYLLGLGEPARIIQAYAVQNILFWVVLAWLMTRWLPPDRPRHLLPWIGCLFSLGMADSARMALLEGPGMLLLALAVAAVERGKPTLGAGVLGLAGLGRETNLLAAGLAVENLPRSRGAFWKAAGSLVVIAGPFVAWSLYVRSIYPDFAYNNPDSFSLPFRAYLEKWAATVSALDEHGWDHFARFSLYTLISLTTQAVFLLAHRDWRSPWWRMGIVYAVLLVWLSPAVWEGHPGAAPRVVLPMTFAFNVLILKSRWFWPLGILGNLSVLHSLEVIQVPWLSEIV